MKKNIAKIILASLLLAPLAGLFPLAATAAAPNWDTTGNYVINMNYLGTDYAHDMNLTQDSSGNLSGNGGYPAGGPHTYTWVITSGTVSGDTIDFFANYTASADAVTPQTVLHITGTIASNGTMSGTWSDNYQGGQRGGSWVSTSGNAVAIPTYVKVTIVKFVDGSMATAVSANSAAFPMSAAWSATNIGSGSGTYDLDADGFNNDPTPYRAITSPMTTGASYTTSEITSGSTVGATCADGKPFALVGYSSGNTLAEAQVAPVTSAAPAFTGLTSDKTVIVWNTKCVPGEIHGTKYEDYDGNGRISSTEDDYGLSGWTMYLDKNDNGTLDGGETSTVTDSNGNYHFSGLLPGTYHVREVVMPGWTQTYPSAGKHTVVLASGTTATKKDFGNFKLGSISGMKYNDINSNGRKDANEPGLSGWTIKLSKPGTGAPVVSTVTDANGNYSFTGLTAGMYLLSEVKQPGWTQLQTPGLVVIKSGTNATGKNFGNRMW